MGFGKADTNAMHTAKRTTVLIILIASWRILGMERFPLAFIAKYQHTNYLLPIVQNSGCVSYHFDKILRVYNHSYLKIPNLGMSVYCQPFGNFA